MGVMGVRPWGWATGGGDGRHGRTPMGLGDRGGLMGVMGTPMGLMGAFKTMVCEGQIQYTDAVQQRLPLHIKGLPLHKKGLPLHILFTLEGKRRMLQKKNVVLGFRGVRGRSPPPPDRGARLATAFTLALQRLPLYYSVYHCIIMVYPCI